MDIGTGLKTSPTLTLAICCYLRSTHPHIPTPTQGEGQIIWRRESEAVLDRLSFIWQHLTFRNRIISPLYFSFLPPSLGENNEGTSAAFEGGLNGSNGHSLWGVPGQLGMSPQLLKQLPVEGGRLGLSCYLNPEGPRGKGGWGGGLLSITHDHCCTHSFTQLGVTGKCVARLLVKQR